MELELKQTPLYEAHVALNARMVDFAGWSMPVMYTSILNEARSVRSHVGLFDISHMGRVRVSGEGATDFLQFITSNDIAALEPSSAQYSLLTNPNGGVIDDIIVYREGDESYLVVINASNSFKDLQWMRSHAPETLTIEDQTDKTAMIAVQGPDAPAMVADLAGNPDLLTLRRFQYSQGDLIGSPTIFCRTGYTGEDGFELILPAEKAPSIWELLVKTGGTPCGLGARDALRIEAGYPLYGHEIDETTSPVDAGLMWAVKLNKGRFIGQDQILGVKQAGPARRLMGLISADRIQPRQGYTIYSDTDIIGVVTSGIFSPTRGCSMAMGYIDTPSAKVGTKVMIAIRDKFSRATVVQKKSLLGD